MCVSVRTRDCVSDQSSVWIGLDGDKSHVNECLEKSHVPQEE